MQKLSTLFTAVVLATSCAGTASVQTGDLLFVGIPSGSGESGMVEAITASTGNGDVNFFHAAILEVDDKGVIWVIDASPEKGVSRNPLSVFLADESGTDNIYEVMRLRDNSLSGEFVENSKQYIGQKYDHTFYPDNDLCYCTELIYDSYVKDGKHLFDAAPMNFKNSEGEYPDYWKESFEKMGVPVPQGVPGTNPQDMHSSDKFEKVDVDLKKL